MKILVFVKQVPDTDDVQLDPKTGNLRRDGVKSMMNPMDANAIEAALQLREKHGGTVCVVTMGLPMASEVQKKALGMGCDEAYLLSDRPFGGADTLATSYTLAKAAEKIGEYDLLLFGRPARDSGLLEERNNAITAKQRLYLFNSGRLWDSLGRIEREPYFRKLERREQIEDVFMRFLSRPPTKGELFLVDRKNAVSTRELAWFLVNSREFLYRI